jgi:hypothetical protein
VFQPLIGAINNSREGYHRQSPSGQLEEGYVATKFRESRDEQNKLTFVSGENGIKLIGAMRVVDLKSGQTVKLGNL